MKKILSKIFMIPVFILNLLTIGRLERNLRKEKMMVAVLKEIYLLDSLIFNNEEEIELIIEKIDQLEELIDKGDLGAINEKERLVGLFRWRHKRSEEWIHERNIKTVLLAELKNK